jgi:hypothetical protein
MFATQSLHTLAYATANQNLGEIDATPNGSNRPESNRPDFDPDFQIGFLHNGSFEPYLSRPDATFLLTQPHSSGPP